MTHFRDSILLVAFFFVATALSSDVVHVAPTTLRYAFGIFRHGVTSPKNLDYVLKVYGEEQLKVLEKESTGVIGSLTKVGKREMMYNGWSPLRLRYASFIKDYQENYLNVTATRSSITVMSALSVLAGIFPPNEDDIFGSFNWQPIPVWHDTDDFDKAFMSHTRTTADYAMTICPAFGRLFKEGLKKLNSPDTRPENSKLYKILTTNLNSPVNSVQHLLDIYDTLYLGMRNGLELPKWATEPQPDFDNQPLVPHLLQPFFEEYFENLQFYQGNEDMLNLLTGPLFHKLFTTLEAKASDPSSPRKMWLHFTHDSTMAIILMALKMEGVWGAEPGDGIIFELHDDSNQKTVKTLLIEPTGSEKVKEFKTTQCPEPCTLDKFLKGFKSLSPDEWKALCHN